MQLAIIADGVGISRDAQPWHIISICTYVFIYTHVHISVKRTARMIIAPNSNDRCGCMCTTPSRKSLSGKFREARENPENLIYNFATKFRAVEQ